MDNKQKYLNELAKFDEAVLKRLVELSKDKKAVAFFTNSVSFSFLKGILKTL